MSPPRVHIPGGWIAAVELRPVKFPCRRYQAHSFVCSLHPPCREAG